MHFFRTPAHSVRILSYRVRLSVVGVCYLVCVLIYTISISYSYDASVFAIPVAFAAWLLKRRETSIFVSIVILTIALFNTFYTGNYAWSRSLMLAFLFGSSIFIIVALFVG